MLTRLYATNYRCLVNFEFKPSARQLIIGRNGAGKTTVFDVLAMLRDFVARNVSCGECLGGNTPTVWQNERPDWRTKAVEQRFEIEVQGDGGEYHYGLAVEQTPIDDMPYVKEEYLDFNKERLLTFEGGKVWARLGPLSGTPETNFPADRKRSGLARGDELPNANPGIVWFRRWLAQLLVVQINPWAMSSRSEKESSNLTKDLSNFADWYRHLLLDRSNAVFAATKDLHEAIPGLESLRSEEAGLGVRVLRAYIRRTDKEVDAYTLGDLSEGQRVLIALYVLLHCAVGNDRLLLIDEPDNFIALGEIQPWLLKLLDRVDETDGQVILVSHHPELLNQLADQGGVVLDRPAGRETRVLPFEPSADTGLTSSEIVARGWESV